MPLDWSITDEHVANVQSFLAARADDPLVRFRARRNVERRPTQVNPADFWYALVAALLTTQQRSGPTSPVVRFLRERPFPLSLDACRRSPDVRTLARDTLTDFGGIRFAPTIAERLAKNLAWIDERYWKQVELVLQSLIDNDDPKVERRAANFIDREFYGFGPKQARNLLQMLGLTRYEIPLDSRIAKWVNGFGFGVNVNPKSLVYSTSYEALCDKLQELCRRAKAYPCVLDAAAFSSFDGEGWNEIDDMIW